MSVSNDVKHAQYRARRAGREARREGGRHAVQWSTPRYRDPPTLSPMWGSVRRDLKACR